MSLSRSSEQGGVGLLTRDAVDQSDAMSTRTADSGARREGVAEYTARAVGASGAIAATVPFQRTFDTILSAMALLVLLPIFILIAIAIKLDSRGPVLFIQKRVGRNGVPFWMYKYRSMYIDAEKRRADLEHRNERDGIVFKMRNDPRVTPVGRLIRKLSLDELPQLLNVLRGDMSLVGPRPALPDEVAEYSPRAMRRLAVAPGLTGLWQVSGRANLSFDESIALDIRYIESRSIGMYWSILLRTFGAVLRGNGAY